MSDSVNHPKHYNSGNIETIDVIQDAGFIEGFCMGSALKYLLRANHKGFKIEDLKKADWYLTRYIQYLEMKCKATK